MDLILFTILAVFLAIVYIVVPKNEEERRVRRLLRKLPGPPAYPLIGSVIGVFFVKKEDRLVECAKALNIYQPLFVWYFAHHAFVNISSPEHIEVVMKNTQLIDKAFLYELLHPWLGLGLLTSTGAKWQLHRKIITPAFHFSILESFIEVFADKAQIFVEKLKNEVGGNGFNIRPYISRCALDIICETSMGTSANAQEGNSEYAAAVNKMTYVVSCRGTVPLLYSDFIFKLTPYYKQHEECLKVIRGFVNKVVEERIEMRKNESTQVNKDDEDIGKKKRLAFLDTLLDASDKLTDEEIRDQVHTFMFGGHDTVTAAMYWTLFELGHNLDIQEEAYKELEEIFQGSDRAPTWDDLSRMNYLERVIKETLRMHPSVIYIVRKASIDFELGGYTIPAGTNLDFSVYFIHMNPQYFPDPYKFNPDHFLPERVLNRHPFAYIPFSAGPRNCIGQRFAIMEEKVVLSYFLRHYKVVSLTKKEELKTILEIINTPNKPLLMKISPRK